MPNSQANSYRRREPRYAVTGHQAISVTVRRHSEDGDQQVQGELLDLSQGGAKIYLTNCLKFSEAIDVEMTIESLGLDIQASTEVCWIRPVGGNQWLAGCSFTPEISAEVIGQMATVGIIERRGHPRHQVSVPGTAHWELEGDPFPVVLKDYSIGGFCLASPRPGKVGQAILVDLNTLSESDREFAGKVRWQMERSGEYLIGCRLNDENDFQRLCELGAFENVVEPLPQPVTVPAKKRKYRQVLAMAAAWVFVFATSILTGWSVSGRGSKDAAAPRLAATDLTGVSRTALPVLPNPQRTPLVQTRQTPSVDWSPHQPTVSRLQQARDAGNPPQNRTDHEVAASQASTVNHRALQPADTNDVPPAVTADAPAATEPPTEWAAEQDRGAEKDKKPSPSEPVPQGRVAAGPDLAANQPTGQTSGQATEVKQRAVTPTPHLPPIDMDNTQRRVRSLMAVMVERALLARPAGNRASPEIAPPAGLTQEQADRPADATEKQAGSLDESWLDASVVLTNKPDEPEELNQPHQPSRTAISADDNRETTGPADTEPAGESPGRHSTRRPAQPSATSNLALDALRRGHRAYRAGRYTAAVSAFRDAVSRDPRRPLYHYLLAMSLYQRHQIDQAQRSLNLAILLEQKRPIRNWGTLLSRYQGPPRLWVEQRRSAARASQNH